MEDETDYYPTCPDCGDPIDYCNEYPIPEDYLNGFGED